MPSVTGNRNSSSRASLMRRVNSYSQCGPIRNTFSNGGDQKALRIRVCRVDVRPGGEIRIDMRAPDGVGVSDDTGCSRKSSSPSGSVFLSAALGKNGNPLFEVLNTVLFAEQNGKTVLTLRARVVKATAQAPQYLAGMEMGWNMSLDTPGGPLGRRNSATTVSLLKPARKR